MIAENDRAGACRPGPGRHGPALLESPSPHALAELDVTSNFSFLRGASHPDELVCRAAELGYAAVALTDLNSLAGVVRAHQAAKEVNVKLCVGARLRFIDAPDVLVWRGIAADMPISAVC